MYYKYIASILTEWVQSMLTDWNRSCLDCFLRTGRKDIIITVSPERLMALLASTRVL